jgi:class 3 adenylate cyclase
LWPDELALLHVAILALASCGSTTAALSMYQASPLASSDLEDYAALGARLLKDLAWRSKPESRRERLLEAAVRYHDIYRRAKGTYSAINAATLFALAGEERAATSLAREILPALSAARPRTLPSLEQYFHWATLGEAAVVLGDAELFRRALFESNQLERGNLWVRARTYTQLARLIEVRPGLREYIEQWHRPQIAFLATGELPDWAARLPPAPRVTAHTALVFFAESPWITQHALEQLAADGAAIHMLIEGTNSLAQRGGAAVDFSALHLDASQGTEDERHALCVQAALGISISSALDSGAPWSCLSLGAKGMRPVSVLDRSDLQNGLRTGAFMPVAAAATGSERVACTSPAALLFADVVGYSRFSATRVQQYWSSLMPRVADVLKRHASHVLLKKTWGDALHAVVQDATAAARIALSVVEIAEQAWIAQAGGTVPTFRISLHFGLVDQGFDPVEESWSYFGPQMSLAARVELVAPPGGIYVTEPFAARLTLEGSTAFDCTYVGSVQLPKRYGEFRLLALQPRYD